MGVKYLFLRLHISLNFWTGSTESIIEHFDPKVVRLVRVRSPGEIVQKESNSPSCVSNKPNMYKLICVSNIYSIIK